MFDGGRIFAGGGWDVVAAQFILLARFYCLVQLCRERRECLVEVDESFEIPFVPLLSLVGCFVRMRGIDILRVSGKEFLLNVDHQRVVDLLSCGEPKFCR